jgi:hypothetical protein
MCLDDFLRLSLEGFQEVYKQYLEKEKQAHRLRMEENRSSLITFINLAPFYKEDMTKEAWLFPWEEQPEEKKKKRESSKERMKELDKKWK